MKPFEVISRTQQNVFPVKTQRNNKVKLEIIQ